MLIKYLQSIEQLVALKGGDIFIPAFIFYILFYILYKYDKSEL
jgi:hypothetical protein